MLLPRTLRLLGYSLCAIILIPELVDRATDGASQHGAVWLACHAVFVIGFHLGTSVPLVASANRRRATAIVLQEVAMIGMGVVAPCQFAALALVAVALQAALFLAPALLVAVLAGQTALVSILVMRGCGAWASLSWMLAMCGFQAAAAVAVLLARRESEARADLARSNAELRAARTLLAEAARSDERERIARELHDVLGHNLTALGLQLEVAKNVSLDRAPGHLAKARALVDEALGGVRAAVSAMREGPGPDVGRALRELCADTPGLTIHLDLPEHLGVACSSRAHCLVRCVQEIVTNAIRHSGAHNLWIRVGQAASFLTVDARDDGRGAALVREGNGLSGMRARIEEIGGRLAIAPAPAFSLTARLPLEDRS